MKKYIIALCCVMMMGCFGGYSPKTEFYSLCDEEIKGDVRTDIHGTMAVKVVKIPEYLNCPQMIRVSEEGIKFEKAEYHRWAEPLPSMIQRVLATDLRGYFSHAFVKPWHSAREKVTYTLKIEINQFNQTENGKVRLQGWWIVYDVHNRKREQHKFDFVRDCGNNHADCVRAQSQLLGELAYEISRKIAKI